VHPKLSSNMLVCRTRRRVDGLPHLTRSSAKLSENIRCSPPPPKLSNGLYSPISKCAAFRSGRDAPSQPTIKPSSPPLSIPKVEVEEPPPAAVAEDPLTPQEVPVGPQHQVSVIPAWSGEPCACEDRCETLIQLTTEEEVAAAMQAEKDAAEAWMAFKAQAQAQLERSAPAETLGKRMRLKTHKAEALVSTKCAKQEPVGRSKGTVRAERPASSRHSPPLEKEGSRESAESPSAKAAKLTSKGPAKAASKASSTTESLEEDTNAVASSLLQLADVTAAAAAVDAGEAAKAI